MNVKSVTYFFNNSDSFSSAQCPIYWTLGCYPVFFLQHAWNDVQETFRSKSCAKIFYYSKSSAKEHKKSISLLNGNFARAHFLWAISKHLLSFVMQKKSRHLVQKNFVFLSQPCSLQRAALAVSASLAKWPVLFSWGS